MKYEMPQMLIYILNDEDVVTSSLVNEGNDSEDEHWTDLF